MITLFRWKLKEEIKIKRITVNSKSSWVENKEQLFGVCMCVYSLHQRNAVIKPK